MQQENIMQYRKFQKFFRELFILLACSENCNNLTEANKSLFSLYAFKKKTGTIYLQEARSNVRQVFVEVL
jgi:hypothetical protein